MTTHRPRRIDRLLRRVLSRQRLWRLASICAVTAAMLVTLDPAREASAHASLLSALPADGVTIFEAPKTLRLEFNEPVSPLVMRLVRPSGQITTLTNVNAVNNAVIIAAPAMPQQGTYVLSWRVISVDGHPVGGVVSFAFGHPSSGVTAPPVPGAASVHAAIWVAQVLLFIGLFVGVGGTAFAAWLAAKRPMPGQRVFAVSMIAGLAAALISLPLQGLDALAEPLSDFWRPTVWAEGFATSWGSTVVIASATLAIGLLALRLDGRSLRSALRSPTTKTAPSPSRE